MSADEVRALLTRTDEPVATIVRAGLLLVARGRLQPGITPEGRDTWRVGPLDSDDQLLVESLVAAAPDEDVRAMLDTLADGLVRTAAAPQLVSHPAYASPLPVDVSGLADWLGRGGHAAATGHRLGLRLETSGAADAPTLIRAHVQLRSRAEPDDVVDAATVWADPATAVARVGPDADLDLLHALRRAAAAWPPLQRILDQPKPASIDLDDEAVADLLGAGAEDLARARVEVIWPADLRDADVVVRAVAAAPPADGFSLATLLDFRWEITVGGDALSDDELATISGSRRPLVQVRGRWVRVDHVVLDRLRTRTTAPLRGIEALSAALSGSLVVDGEAVPFRVSGALLDLTDRLRAMGRHHADPETVGPPPATLEGTLRPYQLRGLDWLAELSDLGLGGCLADDMGLGKTIQVIALHLRRHEPGGGATGPTLVVCPTSLLGNWEREIRRFAPSVPVRRFHGGERHLDDVKPDEIVLATYGLVLRDRPVLAEVAWDLVVADEAQAVKNPTTRTARELRALPSAVRVALTGTPVENRLTDLWSILDWTTPGLLGPLDRFRRTVATPVEKYADPDVTARLSRVVRPFLLRRRKSDPDIAPELPPKTETDRLVPLTAEQARLYERVARDTMTSIRSATGISRRGLVLKLLTSLKQICNHPAQYLDQPGPLRNRSGKLTALDELLDVIVDEGDSVLVFTQYVVMARLLESHLGARGVDTLFLHGGLSARRREDLVTRFQSGEAPVFLLSLKAGGTGLNLTKATHVIHYDRWWNPAVEDQATDRAHRIGQDRPVQVHRLMTEGTLEERIALLMERKRELAESVVGSGEAWLSQLTDDELAELVELRGVE
jgi:superfamily II DNA or RNA helicase